MAMYGPPQGPPQGPPFGPPQGPPFAPPGAPYGAPPAMPPPKKKGLSTGCIVAIVVVLLFFGGIGAVVLIIGYTVSQDKDVQNVLGAIGDAAKIAADAQSARGTAELRGLGCEQAMALDPAKLQKIGDRFSDAGAPPLTPPGSVNMMVMCTVSAWGSPPSCDDAARAYIRGASPRDNFMLSVGRQNQNPSCSGVYSPAGAKVSPGSGRP
jgi:hypothetical protein